MTMDPVTNALTMTWFRHRPAPGARYLSDSGGQYASYEFQHKLCRLRYALLDVPQGKLLGQCPHGKLLQQLGERTRSRHALPDTKADFFEYIEVFYNCSRSHSSLGAVSPERFFRDWIKT